MYVISGKEYVEKLPEDWQPIQGAPNPIVMGDETRVIIGYYASDLGSDVSVKMSGGLVDVDKQPLVYPSAVIHAKCYMYFVRSFDANKIGDHPLFDCGLSECGAFEVHRSAWLEEVAPPIRLVKDQCSLISKGTVGEVAACSVMFP